METVIATTLILLGLRHPAPAQYHAPVRTIPLVISNDPLILQTQHWHGQGTH